MYKKLFATFLAFMLLGVSSVCMMSFGQAMAGDPYTDHEHESSAVCTNCNGRSTTSNMSCCLDASEKQIGLTLAYRSSFASQSLFVSPHIVMRDLASAIARERKYLALAYNPPQTRVGIVVKKE